jgi:tRNA uridine 5-carbamoylmethylation protein Kti12
MESATAFCLRFWSSTRSGLTEVPTYYVDKSRESQLLSITITSSIFCFTELWDDCSFRKSRETGILQLQEMIRIATLKAPTSHTVIIVDDIMYLHSMRRAIYVICRDLSVHHLMIVRVVADLELAMSRNSSRPDSRRISDETIRKIFSRFEEPNRSLVHERLNFVIDNSCYRR